MSNQLSKLFLKICQSTCLFSLSPKICRNALTFDPFPFTIPANLCLCRWFPNQFSPLEVSQWRCPVSHFLSLRGGEMFLQIMFHWDLQFALRCFITHTSRGLCEKLYNAGRLGEHNTQCKTSDYWIKCHCNERQCSTGSNDCTTANNQCCKPTLDCDCPSAQVRHYTDRGQGGWRWLWQQAWTSQKKKMQFNSIKSVCIRVEHVQIRPI